ncbi:MAG: type I methionyl aminopeptidase [Candidatus Pacebacteria bacterium]|nr:type I methionyl aminopeptidase [Candidatus Paceibacterota bacterium]MDD5357466.1 type I methionyl aminopeptidase [Candidatus Paceibacterota bacterium]
MVTKKTEKDIEYLREGGKRLAFILKELQKKVAPGVTGQELEDFARKLTEEGGDKPAFLGHMSKHDKVPYPAGLCLSINDEVVHSPATGEGKVIKEGDVVSLDYGIIHKGLYTDSAVTVAVGKVDAVAKKLLSVTKKALEIGIKECKNGNTTGDIGFAIEEYVKPYKFGIIRELAGHGVGYKVHEDPYIPNYGKKGTGEKLFPGMVIAIEPMLNEGTADIKLAEDGFTYKTRDGKRGAHFEHTILITEGKPEILTK